MLQFDVYFAIVILDAYMCGTIVTVYGGNGYVYDLEWKMTDREFKRLKRADLIEIIYRLQENEEKHRETIDRMSKKLDEKLTKIENAGSIAEAAISLSNVFEAAQYAAERYLQDVYRLREEAAAELENAKKEADRIRAEAHREAAMIMAGEVKCDDRKKVSGEIWSSL